MEFPSDYTHSLSLSLYIYIYIYIYIFKIKSNTHTHKHTHTNTHTHTHTHIYIYISVISSQHSKTICSGLYISNIRLELWGKKNSKETTMRRIYISTFSVSDSLTFRNKIYLCQLTCRYNRSINKSISNIIRYFLYKRKSWYLSQSIISFSTPMT